MGYPCCGPSPAILAGSSAFLAWEGCDCAAHAGQMTNSCSPPPPRTSANWQRSFPHRSKCAKPDQTGTRATLTTPLSAPATRCFSTESAETGHSPQEHNMGSSGSGADVRVGRILRDNQPTFTNTSLEMKSDAGIKEPRSVVCYVRAVEPQILATAPRYKFYIRL